MLFDSAGGQRTIPIGKTEILIGRAADAQLRLSGREVSRRHCRIAIADEGIFVEDLGSQHGTRVNGKPVRRAILHDGDCLEVAKERFQVRLRSSSFSKMR